MHYNHIQGEKQKQKHFKEKKKHKGLYIYLFLNLCGSPDIWHKKLAMASFSGIASRACNTGSNFLISVILICHVNLG